jgi:hypothetical protein
MQALPSQPSRRLASAGPTVGGIPWNGKRANNGRSRIIEAEHAPRRRQQGGLVVVWAPSIYVLHSVSIWQLIINTVTTIITFLLVALLQNTQERSNNAIQAKLNAIADSLADLMNAQGLEKDAKELRSAVGLEDRESSDGK